MCPSQVATGLALKVASTVLPGSQMLALLIVQSTFSLLKVHANRHRHPLHNTASLACQNFFPMGPRDTCAQSLLCFPPAKVRLCLPFGPHSNHRKCHFFLHCLCGGYNC